MARWIEVPVPVDMEEDIRKLVLGLAFGRAGPSWDREKIDAHLRALAPDARELTVVVAGRVERGEPPEDTELAEMLGLGRRELHGLVQEANEPTIDDFPAPVLLVWHRQVPDTVPARSRCEVYTLGAVAALISAWAAVNGPDTVRQHGVR